MGEILPKIDHNSEGQIPNPAAPCPLSEALYSLADLVPAALLPTTYISPWALAVSPTHDLLSLFSYLFIIFICYYYLLLTYFCFVGFFYIALAVLELVLERRLTSDSQRLACLCLGLNVYTTTVQLSLLSYTT